MSADLPHVSIVTETVNATADAEFSSPVAALAEMMAAVANQSYPANRIEHIIVLRSDLPEPDQAAIRRSYPQVQIVLASTANYLEAKNIGARAASASIVILLDADVVPASDWLATLVEGLSDTAPAAVGRTRYRGSGLLVRTMSAIIFAGARPDADGNATSININNFAIQRDLFLRMPLDARIKRDGGCYLFFAQLQARGICVAYKSRSFVLHRMDGRVLNNVRKQFDRGYDSAIIYQLDEQNALRGTEYVRRWGVIGLALLAARRVLVDWMLIVRHRHSYEVRWYELPYFLAVFPVFRTIELVGALTAYVRPSFTLSPAGYPTSRSISSRTRAG